MQDLTPKSCFEILKTISTTTIGVSMTTKTVLLVIFLVGLFPSSVFAAIYMRIDENGRKTYSITPSEGAVSIAPEKDRLEMDGLPLSSKPSNGRQQGFEPY